MIATFYDDEFWKKLEPLKRLSASLSQAMSKMSFNTLPSAYLDAMKRFNDFDKEYPSLSKLIPAKSEFSVSLEGIKDRLTLSTGVTNAYASLTSSARMHALEELRISMENSFSFVSELSKLMSAYESQAVMGCVKAMTSALPGFDPILVSEMVKSALPDFEISDTDSLLYDGMEYTGDSLKQELEAQIESASNQKILLKERIAQLKSKCWLLILVLQLLWNLPELPQKIEYCENIYHQIVEIQQEANTIVFTIRERSYLREEASSNAKIIAVLKYDTAVEILDEIPRWFQVKYTDESGEELIGWISKISVDTEG